MNEVEIGFHSSFQIQPVAGQTQQHTSPRVISALAALVRRPILPGRERPHLSRNASTAVEQRSLCLQEGGRCPSRRPEAGLGGRSRERVRVAQPGSPRLGSHTLDQHRTRHENCQAPPAALPPPCLPLRALSLSPCSRARFVLCVLSMLGRCAGAVCARQGAIEAVIRPARLISPDAARLRSSSS